MCGRTSLFAPESVLVERFDAEPVRPLEPRYNIAPGEDLAVVPDADPGRIDRYEWGLLPGWADDPEGYERPINARAETLAEKPSFRDAYRERRCLVLADGFYEWRGGRGAPQPYRIELPSGEPFAMAGLYERWNGDGAERRTVTIVTTEANDRLRSIHDRMPVVLSPDEEPIWLHYSHSEELGPVLDPYDGDLRAFPVTTAVNDPSNDRPEVAEPAGGQRGLEEF